MQIGKTIREHRNRRNMTEEEVASCLGVTVSTVNKWEKGDSQPGIMLLAPIARLFNISMDTLLSFEEELSNEQINHLIIELNDKLEYESFEDAFNWGRKKIEEYPNCEPLIWQIATILDGWCLRNGIPNAEKYEEFIYDCFERVLSSSDENIRYLAANSLFGFYLRKEQYDKAEKHLKYFSTQNPEKKRKQALIYSKTDQINESYKVNEELLLQGFNFLSNVLQDVYILAMMDKNIEKARLLIEKQSQLANLFEMGVYQEVCFGLDLATYEKDEEATIDIMETMLDNVDSIAVLPKSRLFEHIGLKQMNDGFVDDLRNDLLNIFSDNTVYHYMKNNKRWLELIK